MILVRESTIMEDKIPESCGTVDIVPVTCYNLHWKTFLTLSATIYKYIVCGTDNYLILKAFGQMS